MRAPAAAPVVDSRNPGQAALAAPGNVTAVRAGSTVSISWNAVPDATGYDVYVSRLPWETGDRKNGEPLASLTAALRIPAEAKAVYVRIVAVGADGRAGSLSTPVPVAP